MQIDLGFGAVVCCAVVCWAVAQVWIEKAIRCFTENPTNDSVATSDPFNLGNEYRNYRVTLARNNEHLLLSLKNNDADNIIGNIRLRLESFSPNVPSIYAVFNASTADGFIPITKLYPLGPLSPYISRNGNVVIGIIITFPPKYKTRHFTVRFYFLHYVLTFLS